MAPRGRGCCRPGALGGHGRLRPGQSSLLLVPLAGRVSEPRDGVWGRDRIPVTPLCQLPITPLCHLWEEGAESSWQWWHPGINTTPRSPPRDIWGLGTLILAKGWAVGAPPACTPSAPSPWEQSSAPKAGAIHVMRAGRSLHPIQTSQQRAVVTQTVLPAAPGTPGSGDKGGTWEPSVLPGHPGSESAAPGADAGRAVRRLRGAEVLHSLSPGHG